MDGFQILQEAYEEGSAFFELDGSEESYRFLRILGNRCKKRNLFLGYKDGNTVRPWESYLDGRMNRGEPGKYVVIHFNESFNIKLN